MNDPEIPNTPQASASPRRDVRRFRGRRWIAVVVAILVLAPVCYVLAARWSQVWFAPDLTNHSTKPVDISSGQAKTNAKTETTKLGGLLANLNQNTIDAASHPLDPLLEIAREGREHIRATIDDYSAVMVSQVLLPNGKLRDEQYMFVKVRHAKKTDSSEIPFSVYTLFLKPESHVGQEAIWIEGQNDGKLIGHAAPGMLNLMTWYLDPLGPIAMEGNRYPIYEIGFDRLLTIILEKGELARTDPDCRVRVATNVLINDRPCVQVEIEHPLPKPLIDFHLARIYVDIEFQIPIGYEGYLWPEKPGDPPPLLEKYYYTDVILNPGFTDRDFDPANPDYGYPGK